MWKSPLPHSYTSPTNTSNLFLYIYDCSESNIWDPDSEKSYKLVSINHQPYLTILPQILILVGLSPAWLVAELSN